LMMPAALPRLSVVRCCAAAPISTEKLPAPEPIAERTPSETMRPKPDVMNGVNAMPITYTQNGRQYVTVLSGLGGLYLNTNRQQLTNVPLGGSVWTFALMPD